MRVVESLARSTDRLADRLIPDAALEAEVLHRHTLGEDRAGFFASLHDDLTTEDARLVDGLLGRRLSGEPLAYIVGVREFYGLDFVVNPSVLVPRQETELLVDTALAYAGARDGGRVAIADVGTGSGAIVVAVAHHLPQATVYATDTSAEALAVAEVNSRRHGVSARVHFRHGDLLRPLPGPVDLIVSNPPYIKTAQIAELAQEVRNEPVLALDGGEDGLAVMRRLISQAPGYLRPGGRMLVEIAPEQLQDVLVMARRAFPGSRPTFDSDLLGLPRVVIVDLP